MKYRQIGLQKKILTPIVLIGLARAGLTLLLIRYNVASNFALNQARGDNIPVVVLIALAALLLTIIVTYLVAHSIAKPLNSMSKRARLIADGDYKHRIEYTGLREIDSLVTSFNVMSEALELNRIKLEELAYTDNLTGLFNHRYFLDILSNELIRAERYGHSLSLIVIDIDDFKKVNDTLGHQKGDEVLRLLADKVMDSVRETDIACRIGGEEFAIILPETTSNEAFTVAERLRLDVASQPVEDIGKITISLGIAVFPNHAIDKDALIKAADIAMYQAKRRNKNLTLICDGEQSLPSIRKAAIT